ncbi:MAG TPA: hypothetical protein VHI77_00900 [Solirubrobacterales bacterium]|jgi:hypothetical protein|nr:hypothetical protein [Solirubrobacterales bacterium]
MSPDLVEAVVEHLGRLRRMGARLPRPQPARRPLNRQWVAQVVAEAAKLASERMTASGLPALPHTTPHTLRRPYISIALLANNFDVKWSWDRSATPTRR